MSTRAKGSLTIEAACTIPIFLLVLVGCLYYARWVGNSVRILGGVQATAKELAILAYAENTKLEKADILTGAFSSIYAGSKIKERAGLQEDDGKLNLYWPALLTQEDMIDLSVRYHLPRVPGGISLLAMKLNIRGRVRAWTGRAGSGQGDKGEEGGKTVSVTVNGSVYHLDPGCSHIRLKIKNTNSSQVKSLRNKDGGKYRACELCGGDTGSLYVAETGDRYHSSLGCSGLKRSILEVPLSEVENMSPCSRCGAS